MNNILFPIIIALIGILFLLKPVITFIVSFKNNLRGIKTEITPYTIWYYRIIGIVFIITGIILVLGK